LLVDLRSRDALCLAELDRKALDTIQAQQGKDVMVEIRRIGERPCGQDIGDTPLVDRLLAIRARLGLGRVCTAGSTDCNVALSMGIPSVCFGVYRGGGAHTAEEYIEADSVELGLLQLLCFFFNADPS